MPDIMPWHKTKLIDPEFTRVDLVGEGANSQAFIKLFKNRGGESMKLEEILAKMTKEHADVIRKELQDAKDAQAAAEAAKADAEKLAKAAKENQEPAAGASEEEILKSVKDPAVKKLLETQIAKAKAAEDVAKKMKEEQQTAEAITKAKEVPGIGAEEQKLVELYKTLKNFDEEICNDVFGIFKAANAMISEGGSLSEIGKSASQDEGSSDENAAWAKIEQAASEHVAKGMTESTAIAQVIQERPELYEQYLKAQRG